MDMGLGELRELVMDSSWGLKEEDTNKRLNWTEYIYKKGISVLLTKILPLVGYFKYRGIKKSDFFPHI